MRRAERLEIPVVIVQLWPQEPWREPYVLSPFVVECKAGEGFPLRKIAALVATAADDATALAGTIPVLAAPTEAAVKRDALIRSGLIAGLARGKRGTRQLLALEQVGLIARLRALEGRETRPDEQVPIIAGTAAATIAASYGFRQIARIARRSASVAAVRRRPSRSPARGSSPRRRGASTRGSLPETPRPQCRPVLDLACGPTEPMGGTMPDTELAEELLQLEEADAWFEYLESTRGQTADALRRGRALGLGPSLTAVESGPRAAFPPPPGRRVTPGDRRPARPPWRGLRTPPDTFPSGHMTAVFNIRSAGPRTPMAFTRPRAIERGDSHLATTLVSLWEAAAGGRGRDRGHGGPGTA